MSGRAFAFSRRRARQTAARARADRRAPRARAPRRRRPPRVRRRRVRPRRRRAPARLRYLIEIAAVNVAARTAIIVYRTGEVEELNLSEIANEAHMSLIEM